MSCVEGQSHVASLSSNLGPTTHVLSLSKVRQEWYKANRSVAKADVPNTEAALPSPILSCLAHSASLDFRRSSSSDRANSGSGRTSPMSGNLSCGSSSHSSSTPTAKARTMDFKGEMDHKCTENIANLFKIDSDLKVSKKPMSNVIMSQSAYSMKASSPTLKMASLPPSSVGLDELTGGASAGGEGLFPRGGSGLSRKASDWSDAATRVASNNLNQSWRSGSAWTQVGSSSPPARMLSTGFAQRGASAGTVSAHRRAVWLSSSASKSHMTVFRKATAGTEFTSRGRADNAADTSAEKLIQEHSRSLGDTVSVAVSVASKNPETSEPSAVGKSEGEEEIESMRDDGAFPEGQHELRSILRANSYGNNTLYSSTFEDGSRKKKGIMQKLRSRLSSGMKSQEDSCASSTVSQHRGDSKTDNEGCVWKAKSLDTRSKKSNPPKPDRRASTMDQWLSKPKDFKGGADDLGNRLPGFAPCASSSELVTSTEARRKALLKLVDESEAMINRRRKTIDDRGFFQRLKSATADKLKSSKNVHAAAGGEQLKLARSVSDPAGSAKSKSIDVQMSSRSRQLVAPPPPTTVKRMIQATKFVVAKMWAQSRPKKKKTKGDFGRSRYDEGAREAGSDISQDKSVRNPYGQCRDTICSNHKLQVTAEEYHVLCTRLWQELPQPGFM